MIKNIFMTLATACMLTACIGADISDGKVDMSANVEQITAQAEFGTEGDNVRTVIIRSNRSWFAHLDDLDHPIDPTDPAARVSWATLSVERHQNLTNTTDETEIVITFNENFSAKDINGVLNIWCEGKIMQSIPVTQTGRVYHVSAHADVDKAKCDSDVISVSVDCNTKWTASISEDSTAEVELETASGNGPGTINVTFGENFSQTEELTAQIVFSAKGCEDFVLTIPQSRAVPYVYVLPEYDGRVLGGETVASLKIRSNADWTAEVIESQLEDFTIINPNGVKGTSEPQSVNVSFKANDSGDPYEVRSAKVRFTAEGMEDEPVVYEFRQRGVFTVSFEDAAAFSPEIDNTLNSVDEYPEDDNKTTKNCRPGRWHKEVDPFVYSDGNISMELELSQYIRHDTSTSSLYIFGAGVLPHIKFAGLEGLTVSEISIACTGKGWFAGNIVAYDHQLGNKNTTEYTEYMTQETWPASSDGSLHYIDFDLSEKGVTMQSGQGCTLRTSSANNTANTANVTKMYIKSVTFKYL